MIKRIFGIIGIIVIGVFLFGPAASAKVCNCFCGESFRGSYYDLSYCETECGDSGETAKCEWKPGTIPQTCLTEAQCAGQRGITTAEGKSQGGVSEGWVLAPECPNEMGFCYVPDFDYQLSTSIGGVIEVGNISQYVEGAYNFAMGAGVIIAIVMIMWGGVRWIMSSAAGDITEAKTLIRRALLGLVLLLGSYGILLTINPALINLDVPIIKILRTVDYQYGIFRCRDYHTEKSCNDNTQDLEYASTGELMECVWATGTNPLGFETGYCSLKTKTDGSLGSRVSNKSDCDPNLYAVQAKYALDSYWASHYSSSSSSWYCTDGSFDMPCNKESPEDGIPDISDGQCQEGYTCDINGMSGKSSTAGSHKPGTDSCQWIAQKPYGARCDDHSNCASGYCTSGETISGSSACRTHPTRLYGWPWTDDLNDPFQCAIGDSDIKRQDCAPPAITCSTFTDSNVNISLCCGDVHSPALPDPILEAEITQKCHYACENDNDCTEGSYCWITNNTFDVRYAYWNFQDDELAGEFTNWGNPNGLKGRCLIPGSAGDLCPMTRHKDDVVCGDGLTCKEGSFITSLSQTLVAFDDWPGLSRTNAVQVGTCQ